MPEGPGGASPASSSDDPAGPDASPGDGSRLGFALRGAADVDGVARFVLAGLLSMPGVSRVGIAFTEGGGRRLRFVSSDSLREDALAWCHIDAYDDVPLTAVVRSGLAVIGSLDDLEADFPDVVAHQRGEGSHALATLPLGGAGWSMGALILFYDTPQTFTEHERRLLDATARRTTEAVRRLREVADRARGEERPVVAVAGQQATTVLEDDPRAAGTARRFLRRELADWGVDDDLAESAQLCLSELVTNAIMHAGGECDLTVTLEDEVLTVAVRDWGGATQTSDVRPVEELDPLQVHGRGLMLVEAVADRWGAEGDALGITAWFALDLDGSASEWTG